MANRNTTKSRTAKPPVPKTPKARFRKFKKENPELAPLAKALMRLEKKQVDPTTGLIAAAESLYSPQDRQETGVAENQEDEKKPNTFITTLSNLKNWGKKHLGSFCEKPLRFLFSRTVFNKWAWGAAALATFSNSAAELYTNPAKRTTYQFFAESWNIVKESAAWIVQGIHENAPIAALAGGIALAATMLKREGTRNKISRLSYSTAVLSLPFISQDLASKAAEGLRGAQNLLDLSLISNALAGTAIASFIISRFVPKVSHDGGKAAAEDAGEEEEPGNGPTPADSAAIPPAAAFPGMHPYLPETEQMPAHMAPEHEPQEGQEEGSSERGPLPETEEMPVESPAPGTEPWHPASPESTEFVYEGEGHGAYDEAVPVPLDDEDDGPAGAA
ncbi:hypothetical protein GF412_02845 [Candidatus Micrarchaeota archaeon]|nr:hypothetical protein [Candidatus Micrarchaeota archaeon]MBD3417893.1 hypothetical protein [Candidatus Micrarchaeota archaeon]